MTDRTPPQDLGAEQAVLGGMLLSARAIGDVIDILIARDFYKPAHELIFEAITTLYCQGEPADAVTVAALLAGRGELARIGGAAYLHTLMDCVPTAANAGYYAPTVREHALRRGLVEAGTRIAQMGYETDGADINEIIDRAQAETHALTPGREQKDTSQAASVARVLESVENPTAPGLPTGFADLDILTGGLMPGQMIVIAGRPAMGKSTLALDLARNTSIALGRTTAFFSLEMSQDELTKRQLSAEAGVPLHHLRYGCATEQDWDRLAQATGRVAGAPMRIDDTAGQSIMQIRAEARRLAQREDLGLIVVDYLQLAGSGSARHQENRQQEVSEMSGSLKVLAKELQVPVIAVAQLNRGPELRSDHRPMMSDLRESGALEQDADIVILLYRDDAYEIESPRAGEADLIVAKHRNGPTATITVAFQGHYSRFRDMAES